MTVILEISISCKQHLYIFITNHYSIVLYFFNRMKECAKAIIVNIVANWRNSVFHTLYLLYSDRGIRSVFCARGMPEQVEADQSGISDVPWGRRRREGVYTMMRTSLRTSWRTVGHDDLGLRLRRALAHGSFDTSSIFHRSGVGNTTPPLPAATRSSVPYASPIPARVAGFLRSAQTPVPAGCFSLLNCLSVPITLRYELGTISNVLLLRFTSRIGCCAADFLEIAIEYSSKFCP